MYCRKNFLLSPFVIKFTLKIKEDSHPCISAYFFSIVFFQMAIIWVHNLIPDNYLHFREFNKIPKVCDTHTHVYFQIHANYWMYLCSFFYCKRFQFCGFNWVWAGGMLVKYMITVSTQWSSDKAAGWQINRSRCWCPSLKTQDHLHPGHAVQTMDYV